MQTFRYRPTAVNTKNWQELKKPNSLDVKSAGDKQRKATFVAEPLERGFGLNASSLNATTHRTT